MSKRKVTQWEVVGHISVDAGLIKIGDPCYGECGCASLGTSNHSDYCPLYKQGEENGK